MQLDFVTLNRGELMKFNLDVTILPKLEEKAAFHTAGGEGRDAED
jgi:hypothetical protein